MRQRLASAALELGVQKLSTAVEADYLYVVTDTEKEILDTLVGLEAQVAAMNTAAPKPNLLPTFAQLDQLTRELPPTTDPTLLHYLHKRSYQKARLFLQDRDIENSQGNCGHV